MFKILLSSIDKNKTWENVNQVNCITENGEIGILSNHINLISSLKPGLVVIKTQNDEVVPVFVLGGILVFEDNVLNLKVLDFGMSDSVAEADSELEKEIIKVQELVKQAFYNGGSFEETLDIQKLINFEIEARKELLSKFKN